jgi:hypothetical protein
MNVVLHGTVRGRTVELDRVGSKGSEQGVRSSKGSDLHVQTYTFNFWETRKGRQQG